MCLCNGHIPQEEKTGVTNLCKTLYDGKKNEFMLESNNISVKTMVYLKKTMNLYWKIMSAE